MDSGGYLLACLRNGFAGARLPVADPLKLTGQGGTTASIAKKFPAARRRAYGVSYVSFYEVVPNAADALIDKLLTLARVNEWTRADLLDAKKAIAGLPKVQGDHGDGERGQRGVSRLRSRINRSRPPKPVKAQGAVKPDG